MTARFETSDSGIAGLKVIRRRPIGDERGKFERLFCAEELGAVMAGRTITQVNHTVTAKGGTVRGMHFQNPPHAELKLVTCLHGEVFDVAVDLRRNSPTLLQWHAEILRPDNDKTFLIPEGFAHGFQALTDDCELLYFHTATYVPSAEGGLHPEDPMLGIRWPRPVAGLSPRDASLTHARPGLPRDCDMNCRHCKAPVSLPLADLGSAPPSNAYLTVESMKAPEKWYPLRVLVCERCWLAQTEDFAQADELFSADYAYFSSYSTTWLVHTERYVTDMVARLELGKQSHVVEVGANDGYLLQYVAARGIPCIGIEPTHGTAAAARSKGITVIEDFFGLRLAQQLAAQGKHADLAVANNVLAHVPDINDFVAGFALLLKPHGVATFEFPHLLRMIAETQFDTIYHEHYSYLSLYTVEGIFAANGLQVFDVEELATHGGSLRVFAQRAVSGRRPRSARVDALLSRESAHGMQSADYYAAFQGEISKVKDGFLRFLLDAKREDKKVAAYGAAAKGNTLLNYAGVGPDLIAFVADRNPAKQGKFMPGSRIPIVEEACFRRDRPDYVVILPWNVKDEVIRQLDYVRTWGAKFVTAIPAVEAA